MLRNGDLQESERDDVRYILSRRHTHQYEHVGLFLNLMHFFPIV